MCIWEIAQERGGYYGNNQVEACYWICLELQEVSYVPSIRKNLLSISFLHSQGYLLCTRRYHRDYRTYTGLAELILIREYP